VEGLFVLLGLLLWMWLLLLLLLPLRWWLVVQRRLAWGPLRLLRRGLVLLGVGGRGRGGRLHLKQPAFGHTEGHP
jgi:hypothetical protein